MKVVIDCNVFIICITSKSPYHNIYRALVKGNFELILTNEILLEYQEILEQKYGLLTANSFIALLIELPNVKLISTYYHWNLIDKDPDDNKYCDCAIAGNVKYLVTEDKHFQVLKSISFPSVETISIERFSTFVDFQY